MEVLLTASQIADRIKYVLEAPQGERYAIVAFIGARPLQWIAQPNGLRVFCWPLAGGTNPDGVDTLIKAGSQVAFVERLHSKVYHSERGTVIGSPNLSNNALGGALVETALYLPPQQFPIAAQLDRLKQGLAAADTPEFALRLAQLRIEHNTYRQRNPAQELPAQAGDVGTVVEVDAPREASFGDWYRAPHRAAWQLGAWTEYASMPDDVVEEQEESTGKAVANWISDERPDKYTLMLPTLECRFFKRQYRISKQGMRWWFPAVMRKTDDLQWEAHPFIFLAQDLVPAGCSVPFDLNEARFQKALSDAVNKFEEKAESMTGAVSAEFVEEIARSYFQLDRMTGAG